MGATPTPTPLSTPEPGSGVSTPEPGSSVAVKDRAPGKSSGSSVASGGDVEPGAEQAGGLSQEERVLVECARVLSSPAQLLLVLCTTMQSCARLLTGAAAHKVLAGQLDHAVIAAQFEAAAVMLRWWIDPSTGRSLHAIGVCTRIHWLLDQVTDWARGQAGEIEAATPESETAMRLATGPAAALTELGILVRFMAVACSDDLRTWLSASAAQQAELRVLQDYGERLRGGAGGVAAFRNFTPAEVQMIQRYYAASE